jgi:hypothetical protein
MKTLIVIALACAVVGLFGNLAMQMLVISGRHGPGLYQVAGPILTLCHGVPPILLSIVLLDRREAH